METYIQDWEELNISLRRLMAIGFEEHDAKIALCQAIADRRIDLRALVGGTDAYAGVTVQRTAIDPPLRLSPSCFDWDHSRPLSEWSCGRKEIKERAIQLLELSTGDLEDLFPGVSAVKIKTGLRHAPSDGSSSSRRIAKLAIEPQFEKWRIQRGNDTPTVAEDIAYMRQFGVSRDEVRELRKKYPRRKRGERRID
jgi:hypothetical protein